MKKISYKIYTLGCKVNQYDSLSIADSIEALDFTEAESDVDLVLLNTCAVTKTAITKAHRLINSAKKENPKAKFFLCGCWPKVYKDEIDSSKFDLVCGVGEKEIIIKRLKQLFDIDVKGDSKYVSKKMNKARYTIKIQDGCEQFCSYCIIPYARGKLKSRGRAEILLEIAEVIAAGFQEIVLSGIHLGLYGVDLPEDYYLVDLLSDILKIEGDYRIRLSSIEVTEVNDKLITLITNNKKICNHLHIPLQAGSDKILKLMNRPYTLKGFREKLEMLRNKISDIAISTDIIVGFPGETDEDFDQTYCFSKEMKFSKIHVFPFSAHEKTPAFKMKNKLSQLKIKKRAVELRLLSSRLREKYKKQFLGKEMTILVEKVYNNKIVGKTEYYFNISVKNNNRDKYSRGKFVQVKYLT